MTEAAPAPRFLANMREGALRPHVVLRVRSAEEAGRPEGWSAYRPRFMAELEEGAEMMIGTAPARVIWVDGDAAVIAVGSRVWIISQIRPSEVQGNALSFLQGAGVQEWVVREAL